MSLPKRTVKSPVGRPVIGWREWLRLPDLGVKSIKAKVDTGARTSSLHAFDLEEIERNGVVWVRFMIHPDQRTSHPSIPVELPLLARRRVRDSGGKTELRPVVETTAELLGQRWPIELTLTRRDSMGFRMLLGRQAIRRRFVVDPGGSFFGGKRILKKTSAPRGPRSLKPRGRRSGP
ncbi:MAG: ATP-dependent zinc protease [Gemmatimonadetes bacterium]|nr:ATP-dependent zinc protease [Gemmatimonadota bacterium]NNM07145.1 ATP-dependent zinc protease [Gemmatimonadota bacterium]